MTERPAIPLRRGSSRSRFIVPVAAAGLIVACVGVLLHSTHRAHTVSHVTRTIRDIALAGNAVDAPLGAGTVGPWKIAAEDVDLLTGEFINFRLDSGPMLVTARRAALLVDPDADTFSFEMWDVVFTRTPDGRKPDGDSYVHRLDYHLVGPAPYGADIVRDAPAAAPPPPSEPGNSSLVSADDAAEQ